MSQKYFVAVIDRTGLGCHLAGFAAITYVDPTKIDCKVPEHTPTTWQVGDVLWQDEDQSWHDLPPEQRNP